MAMSATPQMMKWRGEFGREYTERNALSFEAYEKKFKDTFGLKRTELNQRFLQCVPKSVRVLEVGCNIGNQLIGLNKLGFKDLWGIELRFDAAKILKERSSRTRVLQSEAFRLPFKAGSFDLIFTSGVLIHIAPHQLDVVLNEIHRCARTYIWGFEYWAEQWTEIPYRGHKGLLWKGDYLGKYLESFKDLILLKEEKVKYLDEPLTDVMFLLKKKR